MTTEKTIQIPTLPTYFQRIIDAENSQVERMMQVDMNIGPLSPAACEDLQKQEDAFSKAYFLMPVLLSTIPRGQLQAHFTGYGNDSYTDQQLDAALIGWLQTGLARILAFSEEQIDSEWQRYLHEDDFTPSREDLDTESICNYGYDHSEWCPMCEVGASPE